ncbi:MAG: peptidoglycan DD-metalloendopeptidase family protein [Synergistaceae bacterium]|nr:peptidoglycan DD-metalloendopeptidase family protein [Synergistaceae bacterium]
MKRLFAAFLAVLVLFRFSSEGWGAANSLERELAAQRRVRGELDKKIKQYKETADKKARQTQSLQGRLTTLRQDFKMAQQQFRILELQSGRLQKTMAELNLDIEETAIRANSLVRELQGRLINIYKYGPREEMNLLISAENTHDAITSAYLLGRLARSDQAAAEDLLNRITELDRARNEMEKNRARLEERVEELKTQRERYDAVISETSTLLFGTQRERRGAEAAVREMERIQQEIEHTITASLRQKREREARVSAAISGAPPEAALTLPVPTLGDGPLEWPIRGPITSPYGASVHPEFKTKTFNSGIDIGAASGTAVRAAGPGEVLYEGWLDGFGQVIIIGHGRNLSTVYAHLAATRVRERDTVQAGVIIGTVGSAGVSRGAGLHFEVREGASAKNPLNYLRKT